MLHVIQRYSVMLVTGNMVAIDKRGNRVRKLLIDYRQKTPVTIC